MSNKLARISGKKPFSIINENEEIDVKLAHHSQHSPPEARRNLVNSIKKETKEIHRDALRRGVL